MDIINIIAIITSPIIAVCVTNYINNKNEKRRLKSNILSTLLINQYLVNAQTRVESLSIIPLVFKKDKKVIEQFYIYKRTRSDFRSSLNSPDGRMTTLKSVAMTDAYTKLIEEIAKVLGYGEELSWEKMKDQIIPQFYVDSNGDKIFY